MLNMKYKTVMLVDDDEDSNFLNNWILKQSFAETVLIQNSAAGALEFLRNQTVSDGLPDVILLDIRMPVMDGFGFLEVFENLSESVKNKCKIVMLSSSLDKGDYNKAMSNKHVYSFLNKPLSIRDLSEI